MSRYNLQPNEVVVLTESGVAHGGVFAGYTDELMLTNLCLVLVKKGIFGNTKSVLTFPVNGVKVWNGQAQAKVGEARNGTPALQVYFLNGLETFSFQSGGKRKVAEWAARINEVVTGTPAPTNQMAGSMAIPGADVVAGVLADTFNVFKDRFGRGPQAPVHVSCSCWSCGASITGTQGTTVTCGYCRTAQQL